MNVTYVSDDDYKAWAAKHNKQRVVNTAGR